MDIIKFKTGEELPVSFPFDAMVELMADDPILTYLEKYSSIKHQIEVLGVGLKWASTQAGQQWRKTPKEIKELAKSNPRQLKEVFRIYDAEVAKFLRVYFSEEMEDIELSEKEIAEQEKAVKN